MTLLDIRVAAAKERAKIREARVSGAWEADIGPAGFLGTRREKPLLTDRQNQLVGKFAPTEHASSYRDAICSRLSGCPGDAAVAAAIYAALVERGIPATEARSMLGIVQSKKPRIGGGREAMGTPIA